MWNVRKSNLRIFCQGQRSNFWLGCCLCFLPKCKTRFPLCQVCLFYCKVGLSLMSNLESPLMRLRTLRRCSQQDLAKAIGVSRQTISNWENGREEPKLKLSQYKALCKALGLDSIQELPDSFAPQPIEATAIINQ